MDILAVLGGQGGGRKDRNWEILGGGGVKLSIRAPPLARSTNRKQSRRPDGMY